MSRVSRWALLCFSSLSLFAQPGIGQNGVVNRASQIPTTLPGGSIAHGAAFTIRGVRFGSAPMVSVRSGTITSSVRVLSAQPDRIDAIMPESAPVGKASLTVIVGGSASKPFAMEIAPSNPGIFSQNKAGWGPGQIENIDSLGKRSLNSVANPAIPGQSVAMRITGLGKKVAAVVMVGNRAVNAGAARALSQPGEQEFSFTIPPNAPQGCHVPVYLQASPNRASNVVTIAIQANRSAKCDPGPVPALDAKRIGMIVVTRTNIYKKGGNINKGEVIATFAVREADPSLSPILLLPPPGTCTAYTSSFQSAKSLPMTVSTALYGELGTDGLAAGSQLTVGRDNRRRIISSDQNAIGYYHGPVPPALLNPGKFFLSGPSGVDVGAFRVTTEAPAPFEWTGRDQTEVVQRGRGLDLHWKGLGKGRWILLLATNVDQITTAIGTTICMAPLNATHFEIPAAMLANIPASNDTLGTLYDQVFAVSIPAKAAPIAAAGIGAGALFTIYSNGRSVQFH